MACQYVHCASFERLPGDAPLTGPIVLSGTEFSSSGISLITTVPTGSDCPGTVPGILAPSNNFSEYPVLTSMDPSNPNLCNDVPVRIDFATPVDEMWIMFRGAHVAYRLDLYSADGTLVTAISGTPTTPYYKIAFRTSNASYMILDSDAATAISMISFP